MSSARQSDWHIVLLNNKHDRALFNCGEPALDHYIKQLAGQHTKNNVSRTFVATHANALQHVLGFYSLSAGSIGFSNLPITLQKKLPKYPIPIARIGRLAVDQHAQGLGLGEHLLMDALHRCALLANEIGLVGVIVDAKHEKAKNFYLHYGFNELTNTPLTLFISIQDVLVTIE